MSRRVLLVAVVLAAAACAGVLGLRARGGEQAFPHRAHVVRGVSCVICHPGVADSGAGGALHLPDDATCTTCHRPAHDARSCLGCHADQFAAIGAAEARAHLRFEHARHQAATSGNCMRCHQAVADGDTHLRPPMATCWGCHEHDRARDVRDCDACHRDLAEEGTPPASHMAHEGDFVHQHGLRAAAAADLCASCHVERFCASCHGLTAPMIPARRTPDDPMRASVHRAGFRGRHAAEARIDPGACSTCHQPQRCDDCHRAEGVAAGTGGASPHPRGWVGLTASENQHGRAARVDPAACASCHGGAGEALCVGCHRSGGVGGSPHPPGWSSRLPMGALPCRLCHASGVGR